MENSEDRKRWQAEVQRYRRQLTTQQRNEDDRITVTEAILFAHWPVNSWYHPCSAVLSDRHLSTCSTWGTWCTCVYSVHVHVQGGIGQPLDNHFKHIKVHLASIYSEGLFVCLPQSMFQQSTLWGLFPWLPPITFSGGWCEHGELSWVWAKGIILHSGQLYAPDMQYMFGNYRTNTPVSPLKNVFKDHCKKYIYTSRHDLIPLIAPETILKALDIYWGACSQTTQTTLYTAFPPNSKS